MVLSILIFSKGFYHHAFLSGKGGSRTGLSALTLATPEFGKPQQYLGSIFVLTLAASRPGICDWMEHAVGLDWLHHMQVQGSGCVAQADLAKWLHMCQA